MATSSESDVHEIVEKRKDQFLKFFKNKISWISYIVLAGIVWLALYIRTLNLGRLRDVTTNDWTLGPDLDPFLFLRWAEYIVEHGKLMALDTMRYVPLGYNPSGEMKLLAGITGIIGMIGLILFVFYATYMNNENDRRNKR